MLERVQNYINDSSLRGAADAVNLMMIVIDINVMTTIIMVIVIILIIQ